MNPSWLDLNADETAEDVVLPVEVRVKQGCALLDEKHGPEWVWRIDVDTLDLSHPCRCVLGQLHGGYGFGVAALFGDARQVGLAPKTTGFYAWDWQADGSWDALTAAWKHAILARRMEQEATR